MESMMDLLLLSHSPDEAWCRGNRRQNKHRHCSDSPEANGSSGKGIGCP